MMTNLFNTIHDGGPLFTYSLVFMLFLVLGLTANGVLRKTASEKMTYLLSSISLFALIFGILGQIVGLIGAFDSLQRIGGIIDPSILVRGLGISFIAPAIGSIVFLVGRLGIILLIMMNKKEAK